MPEAAVLALMHKTAEKKKVRKLAMDLRILFVLVMTQLNTNQKARILEEEERIRKKQEFDSTGIDLYWQNLLYFLEKKAGMELNTPNPFITD